MKKFILILSVIVLIVLSCILVSCGNSDRNEAIIKNIETYYKMVDGVEKLHMKVTFFDGSVEEHTIDVPKRIVSVTLSEDTFVAVNDKNDVPELKITVLFDDETTEDVVISKDMITGGAVDFSTAGEYTLAVEYKDKTLSAPIHILPAVENYAYVGGILTKFDTFDEALINADSGSTIIMCEDLVLDSEVDNMYTIQKDLTIDGRGHKISTSTVRKIITAEANLTLKNLTIENGHTAGRCIQVNNDNITITLDNTILNVAGTGASQPITVYSPDDKADAVVTIKMNKSKILGGASSYGIICFVPTNIEMVESEVSGWSCVYIKSTATGSTVTATKSTFNGSSDKNGDTNSFGAIVLETSATVTVTESVMNLTKTGDSEYSAVTTWDGIADGSVVCVNITATINKTGDGIVDIGSALPGITVNGVQSVPVA